jgi:hypothetical protein
LLIALIVLGKLGGGGGGGAADIGGLFGAARVSSLQGDGGFGSGADRECTTAATLYYEVD